jgi:hypothetical protein
MKVREIFEVYPISGRGGRSFASKTYGPDKGDPTEPDPSATVEVRGKTYNVEELKTALRDAFERSYTARDEETYLADKARIEDIQAGLNWLYDNMLK